MRQEKKNRINREKGLSQVRIGGCSAHASPKDMEENKDLMDLYSVPLEFDIELLEVQLPNAFLKEPWEMNIDEKYKEIPIQKEQGGLLYKKGNYHEALRKYERALILLESMFKSSLVMDLKKERMDKARGIIEESNLDTNISLDLLDELMKTCRLNYAACNLKLNHYDPVIIQCTQILQNDPNCIKALFRRGQAYIRKGRDLDLAAKDFNELSQLFDARENVFPKSCTERRELEKEMTLLEYKFKEHNAKEKKMFQGMFERA